MVSTTFFRRKYRRICSTDFWTVNNTSASNPAPFNQVPVASTYYLESGDFFRVNNISLGYKLPLAENGFLSYCRVYVNAINPFITQKFSGFLRIKW
jgi:hypothetical protein